MVRRLDAVVRIGLVVALAEAYRLLRQLLATDWPQAIASAHHVLRLEQVSHVAWEQAIQGWFLQFPTLVRG